MDTKNLTLTATSQFRLELPPVYEGVASKVYKAQDITLGRAVGIKEIDLQNIKKRDRDQLLSEITVWCDYSAKDRKLPQIFSVITAESKCYIVMQWIEGKTLRTLLDKDAGRMSLVQKLDYAIQLCEAVAPIHRNRKQHRDLKPENIQVTQDQMLYLLDFNISAAVPHIGVGTDGYLAPECSGISQQAGASKVDVFAIGVILYELFAGAIPVFGLDYVCGPQDKEWQKFICPSEKMLGLPNEIDGIIGKCMALQWTNRYPCADDIARDLKKLKSSIYRGGKK